MLISGLTVANPTEVAATTYLLHVSNTTPSGVKHFFFGTPVGQNSYRGWRIQLIWQNLSSAEFDAIVTAWQTLFGAYDEVEIPDLGLTYNSKADTCYATIDPETPALNYSAEQGWRDTAVPLVYDADITIMTIPEVATI